MTIEASVYSCTSFSLLPVYFSDSSEEPPQEKVTTDLQHLVEPDTRPVVLMIEDNPADVALVEEALSEHGVDCEMHVLTDGEKAIQHVGQIDQGAADCPSLVVLDLNLPRRHGREVLAAMRASVKCHAIPVVVLSSSVAVKDIEEATALGATQYVRKPMDLEEFMKVGLILKHVLNASADSLQ
jgi:chemotaxis family two-component system response regulator Rcp1